MHNQHNSLAASFFLLPFSLSQLPSTSCSLLLKPSFTLHVNAYTHIHQSIPFLSWASTLDQHKVSALRSRVGWTPARNNEWTTSKLVFYFLSPCNVSQCLLCCLNACRTQPSVAHWKLSPHENRMRMRPKLVPNYKFDPHLEASRLRDNEGDGSTRFQSNQICVNCSVKCSLSNCCM